MPSDVAVKIVLVLLLVMERVKQGDTSSSAVSVHKFYQFLRISEAKLSMLRAYLLALFSHFITKFLGDVHVGLYGPESLVELFNEEAGGETEETKDETSEKVAEIEKEKEPADQERSFRKKKKVSKLDKLKRRRRKGARGSLTDEDESSDGSEFEGSYDEGKRGVCSTKEFILMQLFHFSQEAPTPVLPLEAVTKGTLTLILRRVLTTTTSTLTASCTPTRKTTTTIPRTGMARTTWWWRAHGTSCPPLTW